jgi:hypothetical protein
MSMEAFTEFAKIARLSRDIVITEKIDGTNAQVYIRELPDDEVMPTDTPIVAVRGKLLLYAGSRSRWITPTEDNFGFAAFVRDCADELSMLGPGRHYGEWWGAGIQRRYGLSEKRFSLFNTHRWAMGAPDCCRVVPVLYRGPFSEAKITEALAQLSENGSCAAPGFMKPEGIIIYHTAANMYFKKTILKDDEPKSVSKP